jgi:hypothetical protein
LRFPSGKETQKPAFFNIVDRLISEHPASPCRIQQAGRDLKNQDRRQPGPKLQMSGFMPEHSHAGHASDAAAQQGDGEKPRFRDAPGMSAGLPLIVTHGGKSGQMIRRSAAQARTGIVAVASIVYPFQERFKQPGRRSVSRLKQTIGFRPVKTACKALSRRNSRANECRFHVQLTL